MRLDPRLLIAVPFAALAGCHGMVGSFGGGVVGTGPTVSEKRTVSGFTKINVSSAIEADIAFSDKPSVTVESQKNILPMIVTRVDGDELVIEIKGSVTVTGGLRAHILVKDLEGIKASGAAHIDVVPMAVKELTAKAEGASRIKLGGKAEGVHFEADGASSIDAERLVANVATVEANGASTVKLGKIQSLDAQANGASNVSYKGDPTIKRSELNGASNIEKKS